MKYIDVHSHLNLPQFDTDKEEAIAKMKELEIATITIGVDFETSKQAVEIAEKYDNLFASVGMHPCDNVEEIFDIEKYMVLAQHARVVAIGETGLDYFRNQDELIKNKQKDLFKKHIDIAIAVGKPLMIHARPSKGSMDAYIDALDMLEPYNLTPNTYNLICNFHFFVGDKIIADRIIKNNWTMSFDGPITFTDEYDEVIKHIPIEYIMAETDSPFATGVPNRGKRGDPSMVTAIYQRIAELKGMDFDECRIALNKNAERIFKIITND